MSNRTRSSFKYPMNFGFQKVSDSVGFGIHHIPTVNTVLFPSINFQCKFYTENKKKLEKKDWKFLRSYLINWCFKFTVAPGVQAHDGWVWVLSQVEIRCSSQLLLYDKCLLQQFEASSKELVLHLKEVALALVGLERLVNNAECCDVILDVLPASVAMTNDASE